MTFDANGIIDSVLPFVDKGKTHLNSASSIIASIDIPDDFPSATMLRTTIPNNIILIDSTLSTTKSWLNKKIEDMNNAERKNKLLFTNSTSVFNSTTPFSPNLNATGAVVTSPVCATTYTEKSTGAKIASNVTSVFTSIGGWFSDRWEDVKNIGATVWEHTTSFLASVANLLISLAKGISQLIETLIDLVVIIAAGIGSAGTGLYDAYQAIRGAITGEEWSSATKAMWSGVMGYVAEDHVGSVVANWYKEGNWLHGLDEVAYAPFKSDGIACQIGSGLGYVAGIIALTIATAGIGTAAVGAAGAAAGITLSTTAAGVIASGIIIGTITFSSATASTWEAQRDKSWEGVERSYQKGEIDYETYESFKQIRSMSDEEWKGVQEAHKAGQIIEEDYNSLKSIREMPNEWKTTENLLAGFKEGGIEGGKAAAITIATMGIGSKLTGLANSKLPSLLSKLPKGGNTVVTKLLGNIVEETSESVIEYGSELAITKSFKGAYKNTGGAFGIATSMGLGILLDIDLPGIKKMDVDVDKLVTKQQKINNFFGVDIVDQINVDGKIIQVYKAIEGGVPYKINGFREGVIDNISSFTNKITSPKNNIDVNLSNIAAKTVADIDLPIEYDLGYHLYDYQAKQYKTISDNLIMDSQQMPKEIQEKMRAVLCEGKYENFTIDSHLMNKNNGSIEASRRLHLASLLQADPVAFDVISKNNINLYHGTNSNALDSILKNGMHSEASSLKNGLSVSTGEFSYNPRDFVSFTDDMGLALGYSTLSPSANALTDTSFSVLVGTSTDSLTDVKTVRVGSDTPEVGIGDNLSIEKIKVLAVPESKVVEVQQLINKYGQNHIKVIKSEGIAQSTRLASKFDPNTNLVVDPEDLIIKSKKAEVKEFAQKSINVEEFPEYITIKTSEGFQTISKKVVDEYVEDFVANTKLLDPTSIPKDNSLNSFVKENNYNLRRTYAENNLNLDFNNLPDAVKYTPVQGMDRDIALQIYNEGTTLFQEVSMADIVGSTTRDKGTFLLKLMTDKRYEDVAINHMQTKGGEALRESFKDAVVGTPTQGGEGVVELVELDGKYYVGSDGNHRMVTLKLEYLNEISKATTPDQIAAINKKYTFTLPVVSTDHSIITKSAINVDGGFH